MTLGTKIGLGAGAALLALSSLAAPAARSQTSALESFDGTWIFNDGPRDRRSRDAGIDAVADQLNLFIREIARGEMRRRLTPEARIVIDVRGETRVALTIGDFGPHALELGGPARTFPGPDGHPIQARLELRAGRLVEREVHGEGDRTNVLSLNGAAGRLTMAARIGASQLPADIRYRLTYHRAR